MLTGCRRGFSLIEVLVATSVVTVAFAGLGQLAMLAARANQAAQLSTGAVFAARQKLEELRGAAAGLVASPPNALEANASGYWDQLDSAGLPASSGAVAMVRRWSIAQVAGQASGLVVLRVRIVPVRPRGSPIDVATVVVR